MRTLVLLPVGSGAFNGRARNSVEERPRVIGFRFGHELIGRALVDDPGRLHDYDMAARQSHHIAVAGGEPIARIELPLEADG